MDSSEIIQNHQALYEKYLVPQNVQAHMRLVAAVAEKICENSKQKVSKKEVVAAALIHDLGNLAKMNFEKPDSIKLLTQEDQKNISQLRKKQEKFIEKYGSNAEEANIKIAQEIGASNKIIKIISARAITHYPDGAKVGGTLEEKILLYSDLRVTPQGVRTLKERLDEYQKRYNIDADPARKQRSIYYRKAAEELEKKIFAKMKIKPTDIKSSTVPKEPKILLELN